MQRKIIKLSENTIKNISAGEVATNIQTIVKEIIENALDAQATKIKVEICESVEKGTFILVKDNGTGISEENLPFICTAHYTSKINNKIFESLKNVSQKSHEYTNLIDLYGYRGEALHSIGLTSDIKVYTKEKENSKHFFVAKYVDSVLKEVVKTEKCIDNSFFVDLQKYNTIIEISNIFEKNILRRNEFFSNGLIRNKEILKIKHIVDMYKIYNFGKVDISHNIYGECAKNEEEMSKTDLIKKTFGLTNIFTISKIIKKGVSFSIYIGNASKNIFSIFVNSRFVQEPMIKKEIFRQSKIYTDFNMCVLIFLNNVTADINIHPGKHAIEIENKNEIYAEILKEFCYVLDENKSHCTSISSSKKEVKPENTHKVSTKIYETFTSQPLNFYSKRRDKILSNNKENLDAEENYLNDLINFNTPITNEIDVNSDNDNKITKNVKENETNSIKLKKEDINNSLIITPKLTNHDEIKPNTQLNAKNDMIEIVLHTKENKNFNNGKLISLENATFVGIFNEHTYIQLEDKLYVCKDMLIENIGEFNRLKGILQSSDYECITSLDEVYNLFKR
ncbi:Mlh1 [Ecytonucleospora hepatopenaei]|uniref:Mlh1 n=1 Tax=Ecytonucleospora hepatopenaei TaxID=646526 RepID=A0A1W0E4E2_9MICR|nr:Mlh1 [Ecytonucleospora hepatopenaei]